MKKLLLLFSSLFFIVAYGQDMTIKGNVMDTLNNIPLRNALIMVVRMDDSVLLDYQRTNYKGEFEFNNLDVTTAELLVTHPKFDDRSYFIIGTSNKKEFIIPEIVLPSKSQEFDEVVIFADKEPIYFRGDTLIYVADSFKVGQNAVVEDLLKKLPGVKVDAQGKITSQGKKVSKVLVDGDEFFGSDPTVATKNLGADGVESVRVYEKKNENAAEGEEETIQVMDLKLKEEAKKGYFGRVSGATDGGMTTDAPFYEGEFLLNKFNKKQKISIFGLGSNTPRSSFGWADRNKFGLNNESGSNPWNPNSGSTSNGVPQTVKTGFYYNDKIGKKTKIGLNYSYYNNELNANSSSFSQYFLADSSYFTNRTTDNISRDESHRVNMRFFSDLDSLTTLEINPSFQLNTNSINNTKSSSFLTENNSETLKTVINNLNNTDGTNFELDVEFKRKFKKEKRKLSLYYYFNQNKSKGNGFLNSVTTYYDSVTYSENVDQQKINNKNLKNHNVSLIYVEPLSKKLKLETEYEFDYALSDLKIESYNRLNGEYTDFEANNSNIFENLRLENILGTKLIYETKKHTVSIGTKARNVFITNNNKITNNLITQNVNNLLPNFRYMYKPKRSKRYSIAYYTESKQPSVNALQPVQDNTNPNRISIGNPDLLPDYRHSFRFNFNTWKALSGQYIWTGASMTIINNAFATSTSYDSFGRTISQTVNVNGNQFANFYGGAGFPIYKKILELEPNANASYSKYASFINGQENKTTKTSVSGGINFNLDLDSLSISIGNNYSYSNPVSSLNSGSNTPYSVQKYTASIKWILPHHITIKSDVTYTMNSQLADGYNLNYFIWNAEISRTFLKTENLILSLMGNDILNQNIVAKRQINSNVITDNRTIIISRYFLLKLTLKFNNRKVKEKDPDGWW